MHSAPSVSYPVGRPLFAGLLATVLWMGAAAVTAIWLHESAAPGWRHALAGFALLSSGAWAFLSWLHLPRGEVHWDGTSWTAPSASGCGGFDVTLDLQAVLLVRFTATVPARWLWLERTHCPERWLELRRAVYSRARPPVATP